MASRAMWSFVQKMALGRWPLARIALSRAGAAVRPCVAFENRYCDFGVELLGNPGLEAIDALLEVQVWPIAGDEGEGAVTTLPEVLRRQASALEVGADHRRKPFRRLVNDHEFAAGLVEILEPALV